MKNFESQRLLIKKISLKLSMQGKLNKDFLTNKIYLESGWQKMRSTGLPVQGWKKIFQGRSDQSHIQNRHSSKSVSFVQASFIPLLFGFWWFYQRKVGYFFWRFKMQIVFCQPTLSRNFIYLDDIPEKLMAKSISYFDFFLISKHWGRFGSRRNPID